MRTSLCGPSLLLLALCACGGGGASASGVGVPYDAGDAVDGGALHGVDGGPDGAAGASLDGGASDGATATGDGGALLPRTYGGRQYLLYVPAAYAAASPAPLVVMLHGCTQDPADFAAGTAMDTQAEAAGFLVAYPDEPTSANADKCWNWFLPGDQARGAGEPALLAGLVGNVAGDYSVDPRRVFAAGLSAGAAMAVIVGATYPDVFAAIAVHSGLEYQAASDATSAIAAAGSGGPDPKAQGDLAYSAMGTVARPVPVIVFHGDADGVVNVINGQQVASAWVETDSRAGAQVAAPTTSSGSAGGKTFSRTTYGDATTSKSLVDLYVVHGLAHAWSGGSSAGTFTDPSAPDATALIWQFFASHGR